MRGARVAASADTGEGSVTRAPRRTSLSLFALAILAISLGASPGGATSIDYGDFVGATVEFLDVREEAFTDPVPLYGSPALIADSLSFDPNFASSSSGAPSSDITAGTLSFTMMRVILISEAVVAPATSALIHVTSAVLGSTSSTLSGEIRSLTFSPVIGS